MSLPTESRRSPSSQPHSFPGLAHGLILTQNPLTVVTADLFFWGRNPFRIFSFVGITDDALLAKKRNRDLLEPFDRRRDEVEDFIRMMNPNLKV